MQFTMSTKRLEKALKAVVPAVSNRATLPVLAGVRIEANDEGITLEATDLEASARYRLHDGVSIQRGGQVVTAAKPLAKAIASMQADEVEVESIELDGRARVALRAGTRTLTLDAYAVEDFPTMPTESAFEPIASVQAAILGEAFARAVLCASKDEARAALTSVALFFKEGSATLEVVATDSYRLGVLSVPMSEPATQGRTLLVPARIVKELAKQMRKHQGQVAISGGDTRAAFSFDASFWTARLIEAEFPNWQQLVPAEAGAAVEFDLDEMVSALKAVEAVRNGNGTPVRLSLGETTTLASSKAMPRRSARRSQPLRSRLTLSVRSKWRSTPAT